MLQVVRESVVDVGIISKLLIHRIPKNEEQVTVKKNNYATFKFKGIIVIVHIKLLSMLGMFH